MPHGDGERMNHSELTLSFLVAAPKRYSWGQITFLFPASTPSNYDLQKGNKMFTDINPGPKPKREDGKDDRRHHVNPPTAPKHPTLPPHKPSK